jgi:hypothetical protein
LSRFRTFVIFATLAALVTVLAACGSSSSGSGGSSGNDDPQAVLDSATLKGVKSGDLDLSLQVETLDGGNLEVSLSGPFESEGAEELPQLDLEVQATGSTDDEDIDFDGGLTLLSDRAFVAYDGTQYEVDPTTFGFVKSGLEQAQKQGSKAGDPTACQDAASELKVSEFVKDLKDEGGADVDGVSTTKLSGELDVANGIDAAFEPLEDPACSAQLEAAGPLPLDEVEEGKRAVSQVLKRTHVDIYVGEDDIIRRLVGDFTIEPEAGKTGEVTLDLTLSGVNEEQEISAPSGDVKPIEDLFLKLGINPLELLEALSGGGDFGNVLEQFGSGVTEGGGTGGSGSGGESSSGSGGGDQQAYLKCLKNAKTPVDLQNCASLGG